MITVTEFSSSGRHGRRPILLRPNRKVRRTELRHLLVHCIYNRVSDLGGRHDPSQ